MTYTAWSADGRVVPIDDRFASGLFIETWTPINEQQTARSTRAGAVEADPLSSRPTLSSLEKTRESSKAAAPIFSVKDRLQLIADDE